MPTSPHSIEHEHADLGATLSECIYLSMDSPTLLEESRLIEPYSDHPPLLIEGSRSHLIATRGLLGGLGELGGEIRAQS